MEVASIFASSDCLATLANLGPTTDAASLRQSFKPASDKFELVNRKNSDKRNELDGGQGVDHLN